VLIRESVVRLDADDHCDTVCVRVIDDPMRHVIPEPVDFTVVRSNGPIGEVEGCPIVIEDRNVVLVVIRSVPPSVHMGINAATRGNLGNQDSTQAFRLDPLHQFGDDGEHFRDHLGNGIPDGFMFIREPPHIVGNQVRNNVLVANPYIPHLCVRGIVGGPSEVIQSEELRVLY
jgi:hypothetical protein